MIDFNRYKTLMKIESNYEINKIYQDEFGRVSGIFAVDKKEGQFSHDLVYEYRRKFQTKKVGHAGTLDPFASGLLIILVGKATKESDTFLLMDKEYIAEIALGITTETLDPEGEIKSVQKELLEIKEEKIHQVLKSFQHEYEQYVPIYSSVKVKGDKLRELARQSDIYEIYENRDVKYVKFLKNNELYKEIELPKKVIKVYEIELLEFKSKPVGEFNFSQKFIDQLEEKEVSTIHSLKVRVKCSKGTYVRKLAEDIGERLNSPAMLVGLRRTRVGEITLN